MRSLFLLCTNVCRSLSETFASSARTPGAADLPRLTQVLWDRGWRQAELAKLLGENAVRYFAAHEPGATRGAQPP